jgi:hypothetical protein
MSTPSIFDTVNQFKHEYQQKAMIAQFSGQTDSLKKNAKTNKKIKEAYSKAEGSIEEWTKKADSFFGNVKNKFRNLLHKAPTYDAEKFRKTNFLLKPFMWMGKQIHNLGDKISPVKTKVSAAEPYEFEKLSEGEMKQLEKKSSTIKTVAKVLAVVGAILIAGGLLPLVVGACAVTFLATLPESIILGTIIGCTVLGVAGIAAVVANPIIKDNKAVHEYEAETNKNFQRFVKDVVQKDDDGFYLKRNDLQKGKIFQIFKDWKESVDGLLSKKQIKKLKEERDAVVLPEH